MPTLPGDERATHAWAQRRRYFAALIASGAPVPCWRCRQPLRPGEPFDLGHRVDRAVGGTLTNGGAWPEHRHRTALCPGNRAAGAAAGNARRRRTRSRTPRLIVDNGSNVRPGW